MWTAKASGSVISASKVSATNFELQTNLVSCTTVMTCGYAGSDTSNITSPIICSPPESKLFGDVKIVNGTPHPGPTGVRGRLYDIGKLCEAKIIDKIDRAWVAFLDCDGCPLAAKLTNLQGSNPQAILIYNYTSCILPTSPGAVLTSTILDVNLSTSSPTSLTQSATVTHIPASAPNQASDPETENPAEGSDNPNRGGDIDQRNPEESNNSDNPGNDDPGRINSNSKQDIQHIQTDDVLHDTQILKEIVHSRITFVERMEQLQKSHLTRRANRPDNMDVSIHFSTTIAIAEQGTVDYLFQMLLEPASLAAIPAAIKSLNTNVRSSQL
ncbi:hypothetical protein BGX26_012818 [Mortierella sp. AD094]|nr:hypothetical protein BGX26_012818 [Mortierella sp. AD094]